MFEAATYRNEVETIAKLVQQEYRDELRRNRKYVTRKTYNSIDYEIEIKDGCIRIGIYANESLLFIESGRRKGAKLPVKKTVNGFELVDELQEWVEAVRFTGSYYLLARAISKKGIKGVPITDLVLQRIGADVDRMLFDLLKDLATTTLVNLTKKIYT